MQENSTPSNQIDEGTIRNNLSFKLNDFYSKNEILDKLVNEIFGKLSEDERISQMIITSAGEKGKSTDYVLKLLKKKKTGGVLFLGGSVDYIKKLVSSFSVISDSINSIPLFFAADAEPSLMNIKFSGLKKFNPTNTIKTEKESSVSANEISTILKDIGINYNFAPVCDFGTNKEIIGNRSFGNDSTQVIKLIKEFISTTQSNNIIATAKHFPGHGNVKGDSHKQLVFIDGEFKELNAFSESIKDSVISIMIGHIAITNNLEFNTNNLPSSLSYEIVTKLLREKMNFEGLIITDGMNMNAVNKMNQPSLTAIKAGCDIVLMPSDEEKLINSVIDAMNKNKIFKEQVYESVKRVIRAKICLGLIKKYPSD